LNNYALALRCEVVGELITTSFINEYCRSECNDENDEQKEKTENEEEVVIFVGEKKV